MVCYDVTYFQQSRWVLFVMMILYMEKSEFIEVTPWQQPSQLPHQIRLTTPVTKYYHNSKHTLSKYVCIHSEYEF